MTKKQKNVLSRIIASLVLTVILHFCNFTGYFKLFYLVPYFLISYDILRKAGHGIISLQPFDENFLMAIATVGAVALGDFTEAVAVMLLYQTGELFQSYAVGKSRRSIGALMDIRPDTANIEENGAIKAVDPSSISVGSIITVMPGEKIPIDGVVVDGEAYINTSALTGESVPVHAMPGSALMSGSVCENGVLHIKTTSAFGEDTASKILDLVENASSLKSKSENFISKFSRIYTPAVCIAALLLAVCVPLYSVFTGGEPLWGTWIYRALSFLVTSCPCALVISIPLSFFAGIGSASRNGILIKGSAYMETLSKVRHIVFDKTGTLTEGAFSVRAVHPVSLTEEKLLYYAASAECYSNHPISESIKKAYGQSLDPSAITDVKEISGRGVTATVDGVKVAVGNKRLMDGLNIECQDCTGSGSVIYVAVNSTCEGHILIADAIKKDALSAINSLKKIGIKSVTMLTGDTKDSAMCIAKELGIKNVHSGLLPEDKVSLVSEIIKNEGKGEFTAFCGDGINDAPVLALADVGISMGAIGSDAAIEASDVVLMDDNLLKVTDAVAISKKCLRIVYENIVFAIGIKLTFLLLVAVGIAGMWYAVFADVGVMIIAVLNALRCMKYKGGH